MTSQDHNKVIGIMHLIWGGFNALVMLIMVPFFLLMLPPILRADPSAPPELVTFFSVFALLMLVVALLFSLPPILAGYAMLRRKSWARVMGIIAACVEALSLPFGTALCVYTVWFMFGPGEKFYRDGGSLFEQDWRRGSLPDASTFDWEAQRAQHTYRSPEYVPPPTPPDWRS